MILSQKIQYPLDCLTVEAIERLDISLNSPAEPSYICLSAMVNQVCVF